MSSGSASSQTSRIITLDSVRSLGNPQQASPTKKQIIWKDFGVYLDKKLDWHLDPEFVNNLSTSSSVIVLSDSSYLSQVVNFQICNSCNRPIGEDSLKTHYPRCVEMKQKKNNEEGSSASVKRKRGRTANALLDIDGSSVNSSRGASPTPSTPSSSQNQTRPKKKYKKSQMQKEKEAANASAAAAAAASAAAARANNAANAKKKKLAKSKATGKTKGPVDVEKQCGVPLPLGGFCARSLTCKTHSMGAKRAVPGRSAPYDVLLQQYQKRNQAKLAASNALAAQRRENAQLTGMAADADNSAGTMNLVLDPDEETHLVLEGLSKNHPIPLERKVIISARKRRDFLYLREAYANALITNGSAGDDLSLSGDLTLANQAISGSIGGLQGRCALVNVDKSSENGTQSYATISGEMYQVRAPLKAILTTAQYNLQQQQLFQQQMLKFQQQQQVQQQMLLQRQKQQQAQQQQGQQRPGAGLQASQL